MVRYSYDDIHVIIGCATKSVTIKDKDEDMTNVPKAADTLTQQQHSQDQHSAAPEAHCQSSSPAGKTSYKRLKSTLGREHVFFF